MPHRSIVFWALIAALSGFLFGFDTAVISGAERAIQKTWNLSPAVHGLAISSALWGTVLGAIFGGIPNDRLGRRPTLIWIGVFYLVSAVGSALAWGPLSFMLFRFLGGIAIGISSIAAPAYIAEIAPAHWRGRLGALFQTMIVLGILVAYASNLLLLGISQHDWRFMLGAVAVPAMMYLLAVLFVPESPRWLLLHRGDEAHARRILQYSDTDFEALKALMDAETHERVSFTELFSEQLRKPALLALLLAAFNQLSGINAVIYFAPRIFELTGAPAGASFLATVGIGAVNLVFTLVGLIMIDRAGRRGLMLIGSLGYIMSLGMVAYGFAFGHFTLVLPFIFLFIAAHAIGQGAVIWVYISEIFPTATRSTGQALGTGTHWIFAAGLTLVLPSVLGTVAPQWIFAFFAAMMVMQLGFVLTMMVETRNQTLEELSIELLGAKHEQR